MKNKFFFIVVFIVAGFLTAQVFADTSDIYCHFSLVEGHVYVIKLDQDEVIQATVNYPLIPGDIIYSNSKDRCELQFSNGTVMRMDHHTEMQITSILTPAMTSKMKVTTLALKKGRLFTMNQIYRNEIFQIATPLATVKMTSRSTSDIMINESDETRVNILRGKAGILYGQDQKKIKTEYLKAGKSCLIKKNGMEFLKKSKIDSDFILWNREINKNFKDLHYGKSKIPSVIYRRSPGIVHFAEKFSTRFGTWDYNDLFGYVWKPADFVFQNRRPFFDANFVKINGELVLVPNQAWGWAPAHLGTWFWSKTNGWIWIPGDAFSRNICAVGLKHTPWDLVWAIIYPYVRDPFAPSAILNGAIDSWYFYTPEYWMKRIFGSLDLYLTYRHEGKKTWHKAYQQAFKQDPPLKKPFIHLAPENIRNIIRGLNQVSDTKIRTYFSKNKIEGGIILLPNPVRILNNRIGKDNLPEDVTRIMRSRSGPEMKAGSDILLSKDWNPDAAWARRTGLNLIYSSRNNQVVCPKLHINSRNLTPTQRILLRRFAHSISTGKVGAPSSSQAINSSTTAQPSQPMRSSGNTANNTGNPNGKNH
jgi:hypothetical protein